ncbi:MAG: hypothetical protein CL517_01200 [Actinobacteria bacterium]|nr:hypothetical protein [Actinomycetota bacterium]
MKKLGAVVCLLLLASACGGSSDSDELAALREEVSMLKEQITTTTLATTTTTTTTTTVAPATTAAGARLTTTVAPVTTVVGARFTDQERAFIDREVSTLTSGSSSAALLPVSLSEARCFIEDIVETRGISGTKDLLEHVDQQLSTGGLLSRSDTNAFLQPFVKCVDLVLYTKASVVAEVPDIDADCMFQDLSEKQISAWYEEYFINGEAAMNAALQSEFYPRIPICLPGGGAPVATIVTTTMRAPATTKAPASNSSSSTFNYSSSEISDLQSRCSAWDEDCIDMVTDATRAGHQRTCSPGMIRELMAVVEMYGYPVAAEYADIGLTFGELESVCGPVY